MAQPVMRGAVGTARVGQLGQVVASFAIMLPLLLIPVVAYAVDGTFAAQAEADLTSVTVRAAEDAAQQIDVGSLRAGSGLVLDPAAARSAAGAALGSGPRGTQLVSITTAGTEVTVRAQLPVRLHLAFWLRGGVLMIQSSASARLTGGYSSPSSRIPLPISTL